ncbi:putative histidinol-phosphatase [Venustampulla echinocandica]|uniref:Histidinol-phosphatase n=1 Tax=Venustampulla echinocandica TaxID=2656787 RepID=A0A370TWE2_9HELO|nr:putative histidinol-phosphatase [Venustampulla echinocandica]RDL39837.1 putative histidinol-phosphatase [Venustampulla echinocandica]
MAFSMHSHSGQFCPGHAQDQLEDIILAAIAHGMTTYAVTEHMPRDSNEDLYPEEIEGGYTTEPLLAMHYAFLAEAVRLRQKYISQIHILIGFEAEWIRPSYSKLISTLSSDPRVDFFIGSVHHVHGIPIDYSPTFYAQAVEKATTEEKLFADYFDAQHAMLNTVRPKVVGHFDLIRLFSSDPDGDLKEGKWGKDVWEKVVRNLRLIKEQGGLLEVNSSALRKGKKEPYPGRSVCEAWGEMGGRFTLSDDSHGVPQVGTNYQKMFKYLGELGVEEVWVFERNDKEGEERLVMKSVDMAGVRASFRE